MPPTDQQTSPSPKGVPNCWVDALMFFGCQDFILCSVSPRMNHPQNLYTWGGIDHLWPSNTFNEGVLLAFRHCRIADGVCVQGKVRWVSGNHLHGSNAKCLVAKTPKKKKDKKTTFHNLELRAPSKERKLARQKLHGNRLEAGKENQGLKTTRNYHCQPTIHVIISYPGVCMSPMWTWEALAVMGNA